VDIGGQMLWVADLRDIIQSKRAAGRARAVAVIEILERTLIEKRSQEEKQAPGGAGRSA
jgi:hypothetical protein